MKIINSEEVSNCKVMAMTPTQKSYTSHAEEMQASKTQYFIDSLQSVHYSSNSMGALLTSSIIDLAKVTIDTSG